jgi:hypothetical protein
MISSGSFYRAAVPQDIVQGIPDPSNWGTPVAALWPQGCDPLTYFANHSIVFGMYIRPLIIVLGSFYSGDITFCGIYIFLCMYQSHLLIF